MVHPFIYLTPIRQIGVARPSGDGRVCVSVSRELKHPLFELTKPTFWPTGNEARLLMQVFVAKAWRTVKQGGGYRIGSVVQQPIRRGTHAQRAAVLDMGIDHCRRDIAVAEQFLDGVDVVPILPNGEWA